MKNNMTPAHQAAAYDAAQPDPRRELLDPADRGRLGGKSTSAAKARAARKNGIKGGAHGIKGGRPANGVSRWTLWRRKRAAEIKSC